MLNRQNMSYSTLRVRRPGASREPRLLGEVIREVHPEWCRAYSMKRSAADGTQPSDTGAERSDAATQSSDATAEEKPGEERDGEGGALQRYSVTKKNKVSHTRPPPFYKYITY